MQIQLKQTEIINALKLYISNQGINLNGKTVEVAFTAGRKSSGLTADVCINDAQLPAVGITPTPPVHIPVEMPIDPSTGVDGKTEEIMEEPVEEEIQPQTKGTSLFS